MQTNNFGPCGPTIYKILIVAAFVACGLVPHFFFGAVSGQSRDAIKRESDPKIKELVEVSCVSCHDLTVSANRDSLEIARKEGPTLAYAGNKFREEWLVNWLANPEKIRPGGYLSFRFVKTTDAGDLLDTTSIPSHPKLSGSDAREVAHYFSRVKRDFAPPQIGVSNPLTRPQVLFEKVLGCGACHRMQPGTGGLSGPELYTANSRLDSGWTASFVHDPLKFGGNAMPKSEIRPDHLASIMDYLFKNQTTQIPLLDSLPLQKRPAKAPVILPAERSAAIYQVYCSQCHGVKGDGRGINSPFLFVSPRNHSSFDEMSILNDERIAAAIKFGGTAVGKSSLMPSWKGILEDRDIELLVRYIRQLSHTEITGEINLQQVGAQK